MPVQAATITFNTSFSGATVSAQFQVPDAALTAPITISQISAFTIDIGYNGTGYGMSQPGPSDSINLWLDAAGTAIVTWDIDLTRNGGGETYTFAGNNQSDDGFAEFSVRLLFAVSTQPAPAFTSSVVPGPQAPAPVPLPGAIGLLGAALGAIGLMARAGHGRPTLSRT
jgi:hypothetical protein